jgi:hypothetical protein
MYKPTLDLPAVGKSFGQNEPRFSVWQDIFSVQGETTLVTNFVFLRKATIHHDRIDSPVRPLIDCKLQARGLDLARFLKRK